MNRYIDFVEEEINFLEAQIDKYENHLLAFSQVNVKNRLEEMKKDLQTLKQIKCVLEAWEVVKRYTSTPEDVIEAGYYFIKGLDDEFETLNKALEVEDE